MLLNFVEFVCVCVLSVVVALKTIATAHRRHRWLIGLLFISLYQACSAWHRLVVLMKGGPKKQREEEAPVYDIERRDGVTIRRVRPMVQAFETFAKGRWVGREILEVVTKEFGGHTAEYWQSAFHHGHLRINGQPVPPTYRFQNSDRFLHRTHRHEPPILGEVQFLGETRDYFAVNKPASVPVHPCGAFRYNSLEKILLYEPLTSTQPSPLHLVHRLDKYVTPTPPLLPLLR